MDELRRYSVLDFVRSHGKTNLCRIFFLATTISSEGVFKFFSEYAKDKFAERVTGLSLVYTSCAIHLIESSEDEIFRVCSHIVNVRPQYLETSKCFPMEICFEERFFEKWYVRRVADDCEADSTKTDQHDQLDYESFEEIKELYRNIRKNVYDLCNQLREAEGISRAYLVDKLDKLGNPRDKRLPDTSTLRGLVKSCWGDSLEKLVDIYWNEICPKELDEEIWPFPENQCPRIDALTNTLMSTSISPHT